MNERCPSLPASNELCDCAKSGAWLTIAGAKRRMKSIRKRSNRRRVPVRIYQCEQGVYHLTSKGEA